ncbi:MAG: DNA methyltransferase [bacterium]
MSKEIFSYHTKQLCLDYYDNDIATESTYPETLVKLLTDDLDFHNQSSNYATHNFHSFPAKFPPQLPSKFILSLTKEGDVVLDPMMGSGTTVLEAFLTGRHAIGFDIDPLAVMIAKVKTTNAKPNELMKHCKSILRNARNQLEHEQEYLQKELTNRWDSKSKQFIDYWFVAETQLELMALLAQIENIEDEKTRTFFELAFSATIITKTGGVSLALDLAHTRPHKAKVVIHRDGTVILGNEFEEDESPRIKILTKNLRPTLDEFEKRCLQNIKGLVSSALGKVEPKIEFGDAQNLPLDDESVDLIVTSPPYASNAIDYMRAHKFSLIWLGYSIDELSLKRKDYIGGEDTMNVEFEGLPRTTSEIVSEISNLDEKRGKVLRRYYSEMQRVLKEMYRVLRPNKAAIVVVGNSTMRGRDTQTQNCLAEIGQGIGFEVPKIGIRRLDRNKRMLPAGANIDASSQIQQRMHLEYVIGFYKS